MDSIRSCDMLKKDTKSFKKSIAKNKNDHQSQQIKKDENQYTTHIIFHGKACCSKTLYILLYI